MIKNRRNCLQLGFLVVFLFLTQIICNFLIELQLLNSYSNTSYNDYAITFLMDSDVKDVDLGEIATEEAFTNCALVIYNSGETNWNQVLYCGSETIELEKYEVPLDEIDFENQAGIVVGYDSPYTVGQTISENDHQYRVLGKLEKHISDAINIGIFYSKGTLNHVETGETYVILSKSKNAAENAYECLTAMLQEKGIATKRIEVNHTKLSDFIYYDEIVVIFGVIVALFYVIAILLFRYVWVKCKQSEIFVWHILGKSHINLTLCLQYMSIWLGAYVINILLLLLLQNEYMYNASFVSMVLTIILLVAGVTALSPKYLTISSRRRKCQILSGR